MKIISQSDNSCPIPHQRLILQILPKPGFSQMHIFMPSAVRWLTAVWNTHAALPSYTGSVVPWLLTIQLFSQLYIGCFMNFHYLEQPRPQVSQLFQRPPRKLGSLGTSPTV